MTPSNDEISRGRILLVEDEPVLLRVMAKALRAAGYDVDTAADGEEGLTKFKAGAWDLVVTDQCMPHLSGEDMAAAIRILDSMVPMILSSGLPCGRTEARLFDAVLPKPFRSEELLAIVAESFSSACRVAVCVP